MYRIIFIVAIICCAFVAQSQNLVNLYKNGNVKLVPDTEYAKDNNWEEVFKSYYDTIYNTPMGDRKSLIVSADGSVAVNHEYRNFYSKFSPNGKFEKEFYVKKSNGKTFSKTKKIAGIVNNDTYFTQLDNIGNMLCFDFDGNYKKTLKLDYMARQIIGLPNNKLAVSGWVIWKNQFREFVSIVDYETNEEKIVWDHFTDRCSPRDECFLFNYSYQYDDGGIFSINTMPFTKSTGMSLPPKIAWVKDKLVVGVPSTGEIFVYNFDGTLFSKDKIDWAANYVSIEEQKEIQKKAIERFSNPANSKFKEWAAIDKNKKALDKIVAEMKTDLSKISKPIKVPTFSNLMKDSDDNLLFFEIPKEENTNKFNVWIYEKDGKFVCQSSFICDDYNLQINPDKMVFHKGYIYGLQLLKNAKGNPLRLVRFKLTN